MNFVFLMDPLSSVVMKKDTTFMFMLAAHRRRHHVFFLPEGGLTRKNGKTYFHVIRVIPQLVESHPFIEKDKKVLSEKEVDIIFIRTDPPFDQNYLSNTWLLDLLPPTIPVINKPSGIRTVNEKIWATQFTDVIPRTMISSNLQDMLSFLKEEKKIVIKPTDGYGGRSISIVEKGNPHAKHLLKELSHNISRDIILQKFIPESAQGDKRILLLDGKVLGAVLRVHKKGNFLNNFMAGGRPVATKITKRDQTIINVLKPHLRRLGLYFVGIDIMGGYLVEVNVTSPTCLQEINRLYNLQLEEKVIDFAQMLIHRIRKRKSN